MTQRRTIGAVLFPRFELLDIFGPLEMFGVLKDHFEIVTLGETQEPVASDQGPRSVIDRTFAAAGQIDVLLVPGGIGTRQQAKNPAMLNFLRETYPRLEYLASICTGSGLLAASGLLDGRRATSNKLAFAWPRSVGPGVEWVPEARWVEDGNVFTAAGVAAGIDMALALIARLVGDEIATRVAQGTEYDWHRDAGWDPFARLSGLVD
jgi:transcriptional regulator GlxA family with amidase domain